ncbi:Glycoside Hydrolase Family 25 protein [Gigaspora rosea]|uniref:Glycoside Hydrolase Family 25 protein n=1 Tax=Gigaspora rosea TaxID=44941 RepID=A0A397W2M0_9GLOM|nr:Glycoside Hydrolase Family 25 protein [Gigaspora rosea]
MLIINNYAYTTFITSDAFNCSRTLGFERVIIRGYFEAYDRDPGGAIDSNFLRNYMNAKNGGYTYIDVYMSPCTGRSTCKAPLQQVNDLIQFINTNQMIIKTIWLWIDIDPDSGNWDLGPTKNRQILNEFHTAWKSTGLEFGIYTSQYQWEVITGDKDWVLNSSLPLWYAIYDSHPDFNDYKTFGGWTQATGKQFAGDSKFCGGRFDENIFR